MSARLAAPGPADPCPAVTGLADTGLADTGLADTGLDEAFHLSRSGESAVGFLRVDQLVVESHLEDAVLPLDQLGRQTGTALYLVRKTCGTRLVVSNYAVFDAESAHAVGSLVDWADYTDRSWDRCHDG